MVTDELDQHSRLVPALRFPEFRDADGWEFKTLNHLLSEPKQRNRNLKYGPGDVLSVSGEYGCVNQIEFMGRSYAGVSVKDYHVVETGDVVYTKSPLKVAPFGIIKANKGRNGIVSTLYAVYRPTANARADYIDHYFSRNYNLNSYLQPIVKKGAKNDMKVKNSDVLTGSVWVPKVDEQKKIADCLASIDTLIAAEADKLEALKDHKKGLMQQLFPRPERIENGKRLPAETKPRLRFAEFKDASEWQEKTVGTSSKSFSGGTPSTTDPSYYGGDIAFIRSAEIDAVGTELTITKKGLINSSAKMVNVGDVLIAMYGANSGNAAISRINGAINQAVLCLRHESDNAFLYQYWCSRQKWVTEKYLQGGQGNLSAEIIKSVSMPTPTEAEQEKIANFLNSLDRVVAAQHERVLTLKHHKSGLMQRLFVVSEEVNV